MLVDTEAVRVQRCTEPDDLNFGGWDVLAAMPDGTWACVGETMDTGQAYVMASAVIATLHCLEGWIK